MEEKVDPVKEKSEIGGRFGALASASRLQLALTVVRPTGGAGARV